MLFEFDLEKSGRNQAKHGMDFVEAQALWQDQRRVVIHSRREGEPRHLVIGCIGDKVWTAVVTQRGDVIRIISVRRSDDTERTAYAQEG